ncbi:thiamine diphosphokinase [Chelativorans sp. M5D2P16]|uniref:thiamine diphosphokinase n=1 Tax=Chelativorans sp. M5D2P16 TaxID=3095678 RepID=UPI002ACAEE47|nr:thiamine diphosphokinase [Chelativorans sp. M5D2P16]MDZ5699265.1 thiamine diphosphokinase [Chelativorans sp. M5D2P16]
MSRFVILLGGEVRPTSELKAQIADCRAIAADSGIRHARALGLVPELWTGDFDSVSDQMNAAHAEVPREVYPRDKDRTDGEIAIEAALGLGATALVLVGAFGGERPDHAHLHLTQAMKLAEAGVPTLLTSGAQEGQALLNGPRHRFDYAEGTLFSILAFTALSGLTVEGAKWPLDAVEVPFGSSLTLSNEVRGRLSITLAQGRALLMAHLNEPEKI